MSKAWEYECYDPDDGILIFFADTRNKAKQIAYEWDSYYRKYIDISVSRVPELDYLNHESGYEMNWSNHDDREAMVKIGMFCLDPSAVFIDICEDCIKNDSCWAYEQELNECTS
ncbi:MAG: hypothetical protein ACI4NM_09735 [Bullifex sp.]